MLKILPRYFIAFKSIKSPARYFSNKMNESIELELLRAKAKEEYEYEREQFKPFKEGLEFVKTTGFAIIEENMRVRLRKIVDNCIIEIIYKVQSMEPTEFVDLNYEQRAAIMEKLEHEGKKTDDIQTTDFIKPSFPIIILLKDKKGSGLAFDCESKNEKFYIKSVAYNDNIEE